MRVPSDVLKRAQKIPLKLTPEGWEYNNGFLFYRIAQIGLHDYEIGLVENGKFKPYYRFKNSNFASARLTLAVLVEDTNRGVGFLCPSDRDFLKVEVA